VRLKLELCNRKPSAIGKVRKNLGRKRPKEEDKSPSFRKNPKIVLCLKVGKSKRVKEWGLTKGLSEEKSAVKKEERVMVTTTLPFPTWVSREIVFHPPKVELAQPSCAK
jgi:hypothetical protein